MAISRRGFLKGLFGGAAAVVLRVQVELAPPPMPGRSFEPHALGAVLREVYGRWSVDVISPNNALLRRLQGAV